MYQSRSLTSLASRISRTPTITTTHSVKGITAGARPPRWWQRRPILHTAWIFTDLQKGSYAAAIFTLVQSLLQLILAVFDTYCLVEARPGSRHFRTFGFSFLFVYAGNQHIRRTLIAGTVILFAAATYLFIASIILMSALKKEAEIRFRHWLQAMAIFVTVRTLFLFFSSLVNDLYFGYHQAMLILWTLVIAADVFAFLVVVSNFQELSNITKLEDMAKLKMSTLSSLNASRSLSHHSLDSYSKGLYAGISVAPDGTRGGARGGGSTTGSLASFNMAAGTASNAYGSIGGGGGGGTPSTASSIPLSAFGLNLNPTGTIFTMEQMTGSTSSLNSRSMQQQQQQAVEAAPDGGRRLNPLPRSTARESDSATKKLLPSSTTSGTSAFGNTSSAFGAGVLSAFTSSGGGGSAFDRPAPGPATGQLRQLQVKTLPSPISVQRPSTTSTPERTSFFSRFANLASGSGSSSSRPSTTTGPTVPRTTPVPGSQQQQQAGLRTTLMDTYNPRPGSRTDNSSIDGAGRHKIYGTSTII